MQTPTEFKCHNCSHQFVRLKEEVSVVHLLPVADLITEGHSYSSNCPKCTARVTISHLKLPKIRKDRFDVFRKKYFEYRRGAGTPANEALSKAREEALWVVASPIAS
jgi:hypothetical protein